MGRVVTLGIAGAGQASQELIFDTLCDQFAVGAQDSDGYYAPSTEFDVSLVLPGTAATATEGVTHVCEWAVRCELPYLMLSDSSDTEHTRFISHNVRTEEDIRSVKADRVYPQLLERLVQSENPMLLLLLEDGGFGEDRELEQLAAEALVADIPLFDLARGFMELDWVDLPHHDKPVVEVITEADGQMALAMTQVDGERVELGSRELTILRTMFAEVDEVLERIAFIAGHTTPLRRALVGAREALLPPAPSAGSGAGGRQRMEVLDEATGEWVPAGRGRPRQGVPRRYVPAGKPG